MPGCEGDVVVESKDFSVRATCPCGWKGGPHRGSADSAHDAALADRATHAAGPPPAHPGEVGGVPLDHEHGQGWLDI